MHKGREMDTEREIETGGTWRWGKEMETGREIEMWWGGGDQREGMGLLEYQARPSLRDEAHDGWWCTFTI
jgi:hypothetical protein